MFLSFSDLLTQPHQESESGKYKGLIEEARAKGVKTPFTQSTIKFSLPMLLILGSVVATGYFLYRRTQNAS